METGQEIPGSFDEHQSIRVIKEMIQVSRTKLNNDGILFIVWGWINFITYLGEYLLQTQPHTYQITLFCKYAFNILIAFGLGFTLVYVYRHSRKVTTYIGISLRYVWISMFMAMVLINLVQFNILHKIIFELQFAIFMVLVSFAIVVTGGILRHKMLVAGGIVFGILAYVSSYFPLQQQLLVESIAWLVAFIIPGHIMYSTRKN